MATTDVLHEKEQRHTMHTHTNPGEEGEYHDMLPSLLETAHLPFPTLRSAILPWPAPCHNLPPSVRALLVSTEIQSL